MMSPLHDSISEVLRGAGKTLSDLQNEIELPSVYAEDSSYELVKYRNNLSSMPLTLAFLVAEKLNVDYESLFFGKFDRELSSRQLRGDIMTIPEKYNSYNGTYIKTIANFLQFATELKGPEYANMLRQHFQIPKGMLEQYPNLQINGQLLMDLFNKLRKDGETEDMFFHVGLNGARNFAYKIIPKLTSLKLTAKQLYEEVIFDLDKSVEKNLRYQIISADENRMLFSANIRPELSLAIKSKTFGSIAHSYNIMGWYSGFLEYLFDQQAVLTKLSCSYSGDSRCIYEIDYSHASRNADASSNVLHMSRSKPFLHPIHC